MHGVKRGVFISFEGVEGSGKSTQAKLFVDWLSERKVPHIFVREPGSTGIGEQIREILLRPENRAMHAKCEVFLFLAARSQVTYEKILPALREKKIVVADRYSDSTYAYQIFARELPERLISIFNRFATAGLKPDLTFVVDMDVVRARQRGTFDDRLESETINYHEKVRKAYLKIAHRAKKRIKVVDGDKSVAVLKNDIQNLAKDLLIRRGYRI